MENDDVDVQAAETNEAELDDMKKRLKEMDDEAAALREILQLLLFACQEEVAEDLGKVPDPKD